MCVQRSETHLVTIILAIETTVACPAPIMILDDMVLKILARPLELIAFFAPVVFLHQMLFELILVVEVRFIVTFEADVMRRRVLAVLG